MVSGQLTITPNSCSLHLTQPSGTILAVLHARIGEHHLQTKPVKTDINKQFAWQQILKVKFQHEKTMHFWLSDHIGDGKQTVIGECTVNINVITNERFPLLMYMKQKQTAVLDIHLSLASITQPISSTIRKSNTLTSTYKFLIKSAILTKDMQLFGSMKPAVKISINSKVCETHPSKGKEPYWNQEVVFEGVKESDEVLFTVLDKELIGKDDIVGNVFMVVEECRGMGEGEEMELEVMSHNDIAGRLKIGVKVYQE